MSRPLIDVLWRRPRDLAGRTLADLVALHGVTGAELASLGDLAVRDGINLLVPLRRATPSTLRWLERAVTGGLPSRYPDEDAPSGWRVARELADAIARHQHEVQSTSAPAEAFGTADRTLYDRLAVLRERLPNQPREAVAA